MEVGEGEGKGEDVCKGEGEAEKVYKNSGYVEEQNNDDYNSEHGASGYVSVMDRPPLV